MILILAVSNDMEKEQKSEKNKILQLKWNSEKILGILIFDIGLIMLLYSFFLASNFVIGSFIIDDAFLIRLIFLLGMILVGNYLINKGANSIVNIKITGLVLLSLGLILLILVFFMANIFVIGKYEADTSYIARFMFFFCMMGIGIFLIKKGYDLKKGVSEQTNEERINKNESS